MDPIKVEKIQAMNMYKKKNQVLQNIFFYTVITMAGSLFCCSHLWFPPLYSFMNVLLYVYLPNTRAFVFNPKCLFLICNIIVVFLIGESKLASSKSTPATEIYDEFVKRSRNPQMQNKLMTPAVIKEKERQVELSMINAESDREMAAEDVAEEEIEVKKVKDEELWEEEEEEEKEVEDVKDAELVEEEEEELGLPADELNKRVEDFIARMKRHRRLEAGILVCSRA